MQNFLGNNIRWIFLEFHSNIRFVIWTKHVWMFHTTLTRDQKFNWNLVCSCHSVWFKMFVISVGVEGENRRGHYLFLRTWLWNYLPRKFGRFCRFTLRHAASEDPISILSPMKFWAISKSHPIKWTSGLHIENLGNFRQFQWIFSIYVDQFWCALFKFLKFLSPGIRFGTIPFELQRFSNLRLPSTHKQDILGPEMLSIICNFSCLHVLILK